MKRKKRWIKSDEKVHSKRIHAHTKHIQTMLKRIQDAYRLLKIHPSIFKQETQ